MRNILHLSGEELQIAKRIDNYFKYCDMSFRDKVFHTILIAQYELEGHHFSNEYERQRILQFIRVSDDLLQKTVRLFK